MKNNFIKWYSEVFMNASHEQLSSRWECIQEYSNNKSIDILELANIFFELPADETVIKGLVECFGKDMTFQSSNKRELALLAGTILMVLLEDGDDSIEILLAIACNILFKREPIISEMESIVSQKLSDISVNIRKEQNGKTIKVLKNSEIKKFNDAFKANPTFDENNLSFMVNTVKNVVDNMLILKDNQDSMYEALTVFKQDSNILAWIIGGWSNDLNEPLTNDVESKKMALVLGKELADLVEKVPGPYSAKALISKMLMLCKNGDMLFLAEVVDELDVCWKEKIVEEYGIARNGFNTPILLAIHKSLEVDEKMAWCPQYNKIMGINVREVKADALTWAYQIYLECLLMKTID